MQKADLSDSSDEEYIPDVQQGDGDAESSSSSTSDSEAEKPSQKRAKRSTDSNDKEEERHAEEVEKAKEQQTAREELWRSFQASVAPSFSAPSEPAEGTGNASKTSSEAPLPSATTNLAQNSSTAHTSTIKVVKKYVFAGKEIIEVVDVPSDSTEAKKWPLWTPQSSSIAASATATEPSSLQSSSSLTTASASTASLQSFGNDPPPPKKPPLRRGPRKSKIVLAELPGSSSASASLTSSISGLTKSSALPSHTTSSSTRTNAPTKLTTLEKSAMDWRAHVSSASTAPSSPAPSASGVPGSAPPTGSSPVPDDADSSAPATLADELAANRRGGGFLEKVAFLDRVRDRREEVLEASKGAGRGKRRR